jgi:hypothetical protein
MGRALKISKRGPEQGVTYPTSTTVNQPAAAVNIDIGFPNFGSLTNPVFNTPVQTLDSAQYLGVVGGFQQGQVSATNPIILATVNVALTAGGSSGSGTGRIIRQKGSHKFLVARASDINDEDIVAGNSYMVVSPGTTNWAQFGAGTNVAQGDIFTATINGSAAVVGTGTVWDVGICVLSNTGSPAAGFMSISYSVGDSAAVYASYITNKWVRDWNGMTYGNYSNSNFGENIQSGENQYVANFFTDEGNVTVSGGELSGTTSVDNPTIQLAQIANLTS